jgi:FkbM family methyltransferase
MLNSLLILFKAPYNRRYPSFAIWRFLTWKCIKLLKLKGVKYRFWNDRLLFLNYDSFQCMWLMYNYIVDWEEFKLISQYIKTNDHLADVGANMGFYSVWMSKFVSTLGKIHSFEPDQDNYRRLIKNVELNNLQNIVLPNNIAVSDYDGKLKFTVGLDGENHIALNSKQDTIQVDSLSLDAYAKQHHISHFAYVKIDVEGFEYNVLRGADQLLTGKRIHIIQLEINQSVMNSGIDINDLLNLLEKYDYTICRYDVEANSLLSTSFYVERENYFAVYDLQLANKRLLAL